MRQAFNNQIPFGAKNIDDINLDFNSRDDIPQLLMGLKHIYCNENIRAEVFLILEESISPKVNKKTGRPGMDLWKILVLGTLRLNLNCDYDRIHDLSNNHKTIREILGHGILEDGFLYKLQTIKDNVSLLTVDILDKINIIVVNEGRKEILDVKKAENDEPVDETIKARVDSFVVETNVEYPTDINLLFDALRKAITLTSRLCVLLKIEDWKEISADIKSIKKLLRIIQKLRKSTSKKEKKRKEREELIIKANQNYIDLAEEYIEKLKATLAVLENGYSAEKEKINKIKKFISHAKRQIDQTVRRRIKGEKIPHNEKVFSIFEEHTELISKGKTGVPFELGLKVCILEDQFGFVLHHKILQNMTDDEVAIPMVKGSQERFSNISTCSFDQGFYTQQNKKDLSELLDTVFMKKKGKLSEEEKELEYSEMYIQNKHQHSAVESGINALEVHGLDRCPDHGIEKFKQYIALAVLGRNIQKLGSIIMKRKQEEERKKRKAA